MKQNISFSTTRPCELTRSMALLSMLSGAILYAPGCFFFFPWKPFMLMVAGDSYHTGYKYFRRDQAGEVDVKILLQRRVLVQIGHGDLGLCTTL